MKPGYFSKKTITNFLLIAVFLSTVFLYASSTGMTGATLKNGDGCTCHGPTPSGNVLVAVTGPDFIEINTSATYQVTITGGPAVRAGTNIAAFHGTLSASPPLQLIGDELTHISPQPFSSGNVTFTFTYTAPASMGFDTIYANGNSVNFNGNNTGDEWNFAPKKIIQVVDIIPVELASLNASVTGSNVLLSWTTITETNNLGFNIERASLNENNFDAIIDWQNVGFAKGNGTTTETSIYMFEDENVASGKYHYRIKQVDFNGEYVYYHINELIEVSNPANFALEQNYPNPFNPSTKIKFSIPAGVETLQSTSLRVYDILGNIVASLINEPKEPGLYEVEFDASNLSSGIYLYTLQADEYISSKKMILLK